MNIPKRVRQLLGIICPVNPWKLFLTDSAGALLSAIIQGLGFILFEGITGMPHMSLYVLSFFACILSVGSLLCFLSRPKNWKPYLKLIAIGNLIYCFLTVCLLILAGSKITAFGFAYFTAELLIIIILVLLELKTAAGPDNILRKTNRPVLWHK